MTRGKFAAAALAALAVVVPAVPAEAARSVPPPPPSYFGLHTPDPLRLWPRAWVGDVRLWDAGVAWKDIQPARGVFRWGRLDAIVAEAERRGASITYAFGLTPRWASSCPDRVAAIPAYGVGVMCPPVDMDAWWVFVHAVASRYRGRIAAYELWNEPYNIFWNGDTAAMVHMTRVGADAIRRADPAAVVLSPSYVPLRSGYAYLSDFADLGGFRWVDGIAVHGYARPGEGPEQTTAGLLEFRSWLAERGIHKPIWNTETNYETNVPNPVRLDPATQAAYVARTYLLGWQAGVRQVSFYDWTATPNLGVHMAAATGSRMASRAGAAFTRVRAWMRRASEPCRVGPRGVYRCRYGRAVVMWHPGGTFRAKAPKGAAAARDLFGTPVPVGKRIRVGELPVRVTR